MAIYIYQSLLNLTLIIGDLWMVNYTSIKLTEKRKMTVFSELMTNFVIYELFVSESSKKITNLFVYF